MCVLYCTVCLSILVRIIKLHTIAQSGPVISCQRNNTINSIHNTVVVVFISSAVLCYRSKSLALVSPNGGSIYICCVRVYVCIFYMSETDKKLSLFDAQQDCLNSLHLIIYSDCLMLYCFFRLFQFVVHRGGGAFSKGRNSRLPITRTAAPPCYSTVE